MNSAPLRESIKPIRRWSYVVSLGVIALYLVGAYLKAPPLLVIAVLFIIVIAWILLFLRWFRAFRRTQGAIPR